MGDDWRNSFRNRSEGLLMDFKTAKPRQVEAYLREALRKAHGDIVENNAAIFSTHGYYSVKFDLGSSFYSFNDFRKTEALKIAKAIRALK